MKKLFKSKKARVATPRRRLDVEKTQNRSTFFRRNRTIIGKLTYQDGVGSADGVDVSSRTRAHKLSRRRSQAMLIVGIGVLLSAVLVLLIINLTARVDVSISNSQQTTRSINSGEYEVLIDEYLSSRPLDRLRFLFNSQSATDYLQESHPEVASVEQGRVRGVGESTFVVTLRQPIASWQLGDAEYFVDSQGVPFDRNYFESPSVQIIDESGIDQLSGDIMISSRLLSFTGRLVVAADEFGYGIDKVTIPEDTTRQIEVSLVDLKYTIKFSIDRPAGEQMEDAHVTMTNLKSRGINSGSIDVRVSGRAYYR